MVLVQDGGVGDEPGRHSQSAAPDRQVGVLAGIAAVLLVEAADPVERGTSKSHAQPPQQLVASVEADAGVRRALTGGMGTPDGCEVVDGTHTDHDRREVQHLAAEDGVVLVERPMQVRNERRGGDGVGIAERKVFTGCEAGTGVAGAAVGDRVVVTVEPMNGHRQMWEQLSDALRILSTPGLHDHHVEARVGLLRETTQELAQERVPVPHERDDAQHVVRVRGSMTTPRNVVICGAPRSGTSMLAEIFTAAGYHAGRDLIPGSRSNPHGFFEDIRVNRLNDDLMASLGPCRPGGRLPRSLWWMEAFEGPIVPGDDERCGELVPPAAFVMKDPRFVYTGPGWTASWNGALVIVIVRPVDDVTRSLTAMAVREPDLFAPMAAGAGAFERHVASMWQAMYRSVLDWVGDDAVFVTEHSVRTGSALPGLGRLAHVALHGTTVDGSLHRHGGDARAPANKGLSVEDDVTDHVMARLARDAGRFGLTSA